jgi:glycosyltransferase involved in cell wall biosynthesis
MRSKILILCTHPKGSAPSQRFRFEQYISILKDRGFEVIQESFLDRKTHKILYSPGHSIKKFFGVLRGFFHRAKLIVHIRNYDYVFIHLEACPVGPPIFESIILGLNIPIIYDIDDAIFMKRMSNNSIWSSSLKWPSKVKFITKHALKVIAVNDYLYGWACRFNDSVTVIPTTIDPQIHKSENKISLNPIPIIGWTGTHTTVPYLDIVRLCLQEIQKTHKFIFHVICNIDPRFDELSGYRFIKWNKVTEIKDLSRFDIGIMPVPEIPWANGKVGFKAIQYGALGIPSVVSNVGSGPDVVRDGITGYVVQNNAGGWCKPLIKLIENRELSEKLGKAASTRILERYSTDAQSRNYIKLFSNRMK